MAQVKVYGRRSVWAGRTQEVSDAVHRALVGAWQIPESKRFHRFLLLADDELLVPSRGPGYLVVEVVCFPGRSDAAVRALLEAFVEDVAPALGLPADDLEVVLIEVPRTRWAIRGTTADRLELDYRVEV